MSAVKRFLVTGLFTAIFLGAVHVNAQEGAALFSDLCADCHSIGDGIYFGPDLMGVEQRHSPDWLLNYTKSSKTMIAAGDPEAVALFNKFSSKKMPDTKASDDEIKAIYVYIKGLNKSAPPGNTSPIPVVKVNDGGKPGSKTTLTADSSSSRSVTGSDERIAALEKKLDELLEMQLRSEEKEIKPENIESGRLLFTGRKEFVKGAPTCSGCHNLEETDTFNWNPSAYALATTYSRENGFDITKMLRNPSSKICKELFKGHELTEFEIFDIKALLTQIKKDGFTSQETHGHVLWYVLLAILCFAALIDLLFVKFINWKITVLVFIFGSVTICKALYYEATNLDIHKNYQPEQPIKFSHKIHAGENNIQCLYCHSTAEYSKIAGVPSAGVCMNCHSKIKSGKNSGTFEINKIYNEIKTGKPIKWIKVHNLPDHVFYSHAQHVGAGKLDCSNCHGDVKEMAQTKQVSSLSMGWCLDCHRKHKVDFENKYYDNYEQLHEDLKSGKKDSVTVKDIGGEDCQKCHY